MVLSDLENAALGVFCGCTDVVLLQSTNYWKNAKQQGLPFTMNPRVLYRGVLANMCNNGTCIMSQFYVNGLIRRAVAGGSDREFNDTERIAAGFVAGAIGSIPTAPMELTMIQQQRKGSSTAQALKGIFAGGLGGGGVSRGLTMMMAREGIYCCGFLGIMPVVRSALARNYPERFAGSPDAARVCATLIAGPICCVLSHPFDSVKTCMQGDLEMARYRGATATARTLVAESGVAVLWAGMPWRLGRQCVSVFLIDYIRAELAPVLFPRAFSG